MRNKQILGARLKNASIEPLIAFAFRGATAAAALFRKARRLVGVAVGTFCRCSNPAIIQIGVFFPTDRARDPLGLNVQ
jgi:hypothetical protein